MIDIGSNSMRLTLYEVEGERFRTLFREKIMAGLAGYVEHGDLSEEGIACACGALGRFGETLRSLGVESVSVFATASLRNIGNTAQAVEAIRAATGYAVEVIGNEEEALLGYAGAMEELHRRSGAFVDIGGASTEVVSFEEGRPVAAASFPMGSLSLYKKCVKKILPGEGSLRRLRKTIGQTIGEEDFLFATHSSLVCSGGTARAALKIAGKLYGLPAEENTVSRKQFRDMCRFLRGGGNESVDLLLKLAPDRIHTILPGLMILEEILHRFRAEELVVSRYGVREGYLCLRLLRREQEGEGAALYRA